MASSRLRMPILALSVLSIGLSLAILGCAAQTLAVFNSQKANSIYFLPVWTQHFDTRELAALIGTSTVIFLFNLVTVAGVFLNTLPTHLVLLSSTALSSALSLLALVYTSALNNTTSPDHRDTLQTWTCRWRAQSEAGVPRNYDTLCHETRFAFYTTIPVFIIQLLLLTLAFLSRPATVSRGGVPLDEEKGSPAAHELGSVRQQASFDTRLGTPKSVNDSVRYLGAKA